MKALKILKNSLQKQREQRKPVLIYPPKLWDSDLAKSDSQGVCAYDYMIAKIDEIEEHAKKKCAALQSKDKSSSDIDYSAPYYSQHFGGESGAWISNSIIYSMMPRFSSAHLYSGENSLRIETEDSFRDTGSFLKSICMLNYLKRMGVDAIYLLPIMQHSYRYKKGDAGSCYAVSDFFCLDADLKDPLCGDDISVDTEFSAFVEAAHVLDIKILIDIIPRTSAVNSNMIMQNPDWFYWIPRAELKAYKSPKVPNIKGAKPAEENLIPKIYESSEVKKHILKFVDDPRKQDPALFEDCVKKYLDSAETGDFLEVIESVFDITVAPAFSDVINDEQPAWNDISYLRMYLDHPRAAKSILDKNNLQPAPYILFDVAKASNCPGTKANTELWDLLSSILPHYQRKYGIDGARIDMGHALPKDLLTSIVKNAKSEDSNFAFIAEELNPQRAELSKQLGYNLIIGDGFSKLNDLENNGYEDFVKTVKKQPLPVFACAETHDTPRIASKTKGKKRSRAISAASLFIPNTTAFINSGQELFEVQPMNLGIGAGPREQFLLKKSDPFYAKLALFDYCAPHWNEGVEENMIEDYGFLAGYRKKYFNSSSSKTIFRKDYVCIHLFQKKNMVLVSAINTDFYESNLIWIPMCAMKKVFRRSASIACIYSNKKKVRLGRLQNEVLGFIGKLSAGEFCIYELVL